MDATHSPVDDAERLAGTRVLVADDDPQVLEAVSEGLASFGAEVVRATNGAELIELLAAQGPFDLVVTDVSMPWMSGLRAIYTTRSAGLDTPIIVMTALADDRTSAQVRALGSNATLLRKPFDLCDLRSVAVRLLAARDRQPVGHVSA